LVRIGFLCIVLPWISSAKHIRSLPGCRLFHRAFSGRHDARHAAAGAQSVDNSRNFGLVSAHEPVQPPHVCLPLLRLYAHQPAVRCLIFFRRPNPELNRKKSNHRHGEPGRDGIACAPVL